MGDLQNTSAEGTQTSTEGTQQGGKTFTQDDVNRIVQERLAKEKSKASNEDFEKKTAELEEKQAELLEKENRLNALTALRGAGYPDELADVIRCSNADELKKSMELIDKIIKERTPSEQDKENEANKAAFAFTMPMQNSSVKDDVRAAMGLRG